MLLDSLTVSAHLLMAVVLKAVDIEVGDEQPLPWSQCLTTVQKARFVNYRISSLPSYPSDNLPTDKPHNPLTVRTTTLLNSADSSRYEAHILARRAQIVLG